MRIRNKKKIKYHVYSLPVIFMLYILFKQFIQNQNNNNDNKYFNKFKLVFFFGFLVLINKTG